MPSYRFCRPDDIPFLVRAVNECFDVHFPDRPPLTVDGFRREMKHLDLWPSSSLIAAEGDRPIAVLTGTKREDETLVARIGVRPGAERDGHGGHLITSLSQKLAVLGPPRLAVEVPASLPGARAFFRALGWEDDGTYLDLERDSTRDRARDLTRELAPDSALSPAPEPALAPVPAPESAAPADGGAPPAAAAVEPPPDGLVGAITVAELDAAGLLAPGTVAEVDGHSAPERPSAESAAAGGSVATAPSTVLSAAPSAAGSVAPPLAWERRPESLRDRAEVLRGAAIVSPDRIEAWVLWEPADGGLDVAAWGWSPIGSTTGAPAETPAETHSRRTLLLSLLLRHLLSTQDARRLRLVKTAEGPASGGEVPEEIVTSLALRPAERYHRLITEAKPL